MNIEALEAFGMSVALIIYLLVERAAMVHLLASPKVKFLAPGVLSLIVVIAFYLAQNPLPPPYVLLVKWLGMWVTAIAVKATVKDNERKEPPDKAA